MSWLGTPMTKLMIGYLNVSRKIFRDSFLTPVSTLPLTERTICLIFFSVIDRSTSMSLRVLGNFRVKRLTTTTDVSPRGRYLLKQLRGYTDLTGSYSESRRSWGIVKGTF